MSEPRKIPKESEKTIVLNSLKLHELLELPYKNIIM